MLIFVLIFLVSNVSALTLKITPSSLTFNGEPNKIICNKLTVENSIPKGVVQVRDDFNESVELTYDNSLTVLGSKDLNVCVKTNEKGLYNGNLIFKTIQEGGNVGVEIKVKLSIDTNIPDFIKDVVKKISAFQTELDITTKESVNGNVIISESQDRENSGRVLLGKIIDVNADAQISSNLKSVVLKKYYTNEQLVEKNINEDTLKLYYYNNGNWKVLNSNLNKNLKYVSANLDHFSLYGIFGESLTVPSKPVVVDDGDTTLSTTSLHAQWSATSVGSDIKGYKYAIGITPGGSDIADWTSTTETSVTKSNLNLQINYIYYFSVKAENSVGWSETGYSNGIKVIKLSSSGGSSSSGSSGGGSSTPSETVYGNKEKTNENVVTEKASEIKETSEEGNPSEEITGAVAGVKEKSSSIFMITGVLLVIIVVLGGVFYFKNKKRVPV